MGITTIQIDTKLKRKLEKLKKHPRETYSQLISRLLLNTKKTGSINNQENNLEKSPEKNHNTIDREGLMETIEVLSDPELMRGIKEALQERKSGKGDVSLEEFEKEMRL